MILVGLEDCEGCKIIHAKHPEVQYVVVPRKIESCDRDILEIKRAMFRLGVKMFPVLVDDGLTQIIPLEVIDPELKDYNKD